MTTALHPAQAHANQWAYEHHLNMIEATTHWLHRDILSLANIRLAWLMKPSTEASRHNYNTIWRNMTARYEFIKPRLSLSQQGKYERLMKELKASVALHLCREGKFPRSWVGITH